MMTHMIMMMIMMKIKPGYNLGQIHNWVGDDDAHDHDDDHEQW